jgi:hypothetical protein
MKTIFYFLLPLLIYLSFNFSCKSSLNRNKLEKTAHYFSDSVVKDLPLAKKGEITPQYYLKDDFEKLAGFQTLENGFDSLKIRIGYGYAFNDKEQVVEIAYEDKEWTATFFDLTKKYYLKTDSIISYEKERISRNPNSGWAKFIQKLFKLDILTLPNSEIIPGYNLPFDASGVSVQIATKYNYRLYFYDAPALNDHIREAIKMEEIMELIEEELDFKRVRKF